MMPYNFLNTFTFITFPWNIPEIDETNPLNIPETDATNTYSPILGLKHPHML